MSRRIRDKKLDSPTARGSLDARDKPYYLKIDRGVHLGYRKGKTGGKWVLRSYTDGDYVVETFAVADDARDADGIEVLDFWQAQRRATKRHQQLHRRANGIDEPIGSYTVANCIADYVGWLGDNGKTAHDAETRANALILPALGKTECGKLTTRQIRDWHRTIAKQQPRLRTAPGADQQYSDADLSDPDVARRRKATANRMLTILKAALNWAWREDGKIATDEAWRPVKPFRNVDAARARYLKPDEALRLINACDDNLRRLVKGALATGARYGELAALRVTDCDHTTGQIHIRVSKTGQGRHVILNEEGMALFEQFTTGRAGDAHIFTKANGSRWLKSHQDRPLRAACKRAKIDPPVSFHILRHTYASLAIMAGMPPQVVAENLGHADTRMVEKHYGHLSRKYVIDMIRATAPTFGMVEPDNVERLGMAR